MVVRGSILTMDPRRPAADALATVAGRVIAVGSLGAARAAAGDAAPVLDLGDATVLPGLIDGHNHMLWTGLGRVLVDLSPARSIADALEIVARWAADNPDVEWVVGAEGWEVDDIAERRYPTRSELDRAVPDRPVYLPRGGHAAATNSAALRAAGITAATQAPEGGVIERGEDGEPNGVLLEVARELVGRLVPPPSLGQRRAALRAAQPAYHAAGLTRVLEPGLLPDEIAAYQALEDAGELTMRATLMPLVGSGEGVAERLDGYAAIGLRSGFGGGRLLLGGLKLYLDGAASFGTALLREPYPDRPDYRGELVTSAEDLEAFVRFCAQRRWSLGIHAVGGGAIDLALDTFARVHRETPIDDLRFTLIHAYLWPSAENRRAAHGLGVVVAPQPSMQERFAPVLARRFGWGAIAEATPLRSWLDAGVTVAGSSDSPITPFQPLRGIWQAVTRHCEEYGGTLGEAQRVSRDEALHMYTRGSARACLCEDDEGVLRPGARADWVALGTDPLRCSPDELRDAPVLATAVGGALVHEAR
jgi:predicted amidohydrolase YtcJ